VGEGAVVGSFVAVLVASSVGALVGVGVSSSTAVQPNEKAINKTNMIDF
jgi:hypothetical protein